MVDTPRHTYQILTKRADRMVGAIQQLALPLPANIWLGVSAENQRYFDERVAWLACTEAMTRFVSAEPLLGAIDIGGYDDILDWLIVGGESGSGRRPMELNWARSLRDQCQEAGIAYFFKQGNSHRPGGDSLLDGVEYRAFPGGE